MTAPRDRVGVSWRPQMAGALLARIDEIDVFEVLADDYARAPRDEQAGIALLARHTPVILHGTGLGLAGAAALPPARLDAMARLCATVGPEAWSEHLAFVRAGGRELGHLAAPPRTAASIDAAAVNLRRARQVVGSAPLVENVATLIDPPGSTRDEPSWIAAVLAASGARLVLDLHNLHANATNFGWPARRLLDTIPIDRVAMVHVAGGRWVTAEHAGGRRLLDDHRHAVPDAVYALLTDLATRAPHQLTVILERDGAFETFELDDELARVRAALAHGRAARRFAAGART